LALFKTKERVLGIDISASAVKLMELGRSGQRYKVEAMAIEPLAEGAMENRNPADLDAVSAAIKRALRASGSRLRKAAVAVPTSSVITRTVPVPIEYDEDAIEANIQLDAPNYIPFPLEEIYLDFQLQGPSRASKSVQDVMLVASRQENVDLRQEVLQGAGVKPIIVDVEAYALENTAHLMLQQLAQQGGDESVTLNKSKGSGLVALVDIGTSITTLYVLKDDRIIFTREQSFGSEQLTRAIADAYELPKDRAELAKRSGDLSDDYPTTILAPFQQSAVEQISQALQFFFSADHYDIGQANSVDSIVLVGGGAMVADLDRIITDLLGIPTVVGNPFVHMGNATRVNRHSLLRDAPLFAVACGLALRSFD
jgi:type IV pilus assembly protein PilM